MFSVSDYQIREQEQKSALSSLNLNQQEIIENFPAFFRRKDMVRFLAHYELFKQIIDLPGVVLDLGVFRGNSLFTWTKLMETFCPGDRSRKVYGFDWFQGLQDFSAEDGALNETSAKLEGGYKADQAVLEKLVDVHNQDGFLPGIDRVKLVLGDVRKTIPHFLEQNPGIRISLLHCDLDLYEPTLVALEHLYPLVVPGGLVVLDEFALAPWEGESRAVESYFEKQGLKMPVIRKFPFSQQPHGYFVKE